MNWFIPMRLKRPTILLLIAAGAAVTTSPIFAATQMVTLRVPGMTCAVCPITIREALKKVPGVIKIRPSLKRKVVSVSYDDKKTNIKQLEKTMRNAGYPATVQPGKTK